MDISGPRLDDLREPDKWPWPVADGFKAIDRLQLLATASGAVIYNISFRRAGWGIVFYEEARDPNPDRGKPTAGSDEWRQGLVVYQYYPTLAECVEAELKRLDAAHDARGESG